MGEAAKKVVPIRNPLAAYKSEYEVFKSAEKRVKELREEIFARMDAAKTNKTKCGDFKAERTVTVQERGTNHENN